MKTWGIVLGILVILTILFSPVLAMSKSDLISQYKTGQSLKPTIPIPTPTPTPTLTPEEMYLPYIHGSCDSYIIPTASSAKVPGGKEFLTIRSNPEGAFVYLDGRFRGLSPLLLTGLSAGSHQLTLTKFGYADYVTNFTVLEGRSFSGNMRPYPGCENWLPCITLEEVNQIHGGLI